MSLSNNFSNNLSSLRKSHKASLAEFASETQMSRSHLQNALKGTCNPTLATVEQVAKGLQVDPLSLLSLPTDVDSADLSPFFIQKMEEIKLHLLAVLHILDEILPEESDSQKAE